VSRFGRARPLNPRARAHPARTLALAIGTLVVVVACSPLYIPLVPDDGLPAPHPTRLSGDSSLGLNDAGRPRLELEVLDVPAAGWLAVQWLGPDGRETASESVRVEPGAARAVFELPADVPLRPGEWRAVVSYGDALLRQFLITVP